MQHLVADVQLGGHIDQRRVCRTVFDYLYFLFIRQFLYRRINLVLYRLYQRFAFRFLFRDMNKRIRFTRGGTILSRWMINGRTWPSTEKNETDHYSRISIHQQEHSFSFPVDASFHDPCYPSDDQPDQSKDQFSCRKWDLQHFSFPQNPRDRDQFSKPNRKSPFLQLPSVSTMI